jgi:hypothetical protein
MLLALVLATAAHADSITIVSENQSIAVSGVTNDPIDGSQSYSLTALSGSISDALVGSGVSASSQAQQNTTVAGDLITVNSQINGQSRIPLQQTRGESADALASSDFSLVFTVDTLSTFSFSSSFTKLGSAGAQFSQDFSLVGAESGIVLSSLIQGEGAPLTGDLAPDTYTLTLNDSLMTGEDPLGAYANVQGQFNLGVESVVSAPDRTPTWALLAGSLAAILALKRTIADHPRPAMRRI